MQKNRGIEKHINGKIQESDDCHEKAWSIEIVWNWLQRKREDVWCADRECSIIWSRNMGMQEVRLDSIIERKHIK